jgi:hypothetical protein
MWNQLTVVRRREALWSGSHFFDAPLADPDAVYCGNKDGQLVRLDRHTLRDVWRVDAEGRYLGGSCGSHLLATDWRRKRTAAVLKESGATTWVADRDPWWGSSVWRDRILLFSDVIEILDPATGRCLDRIELPNGPISGNVQMCGDLLLLLPRDRGPVRAFDLLSRTLLWQRDIVAEGGERFGIAEKPVGGMQQNQLIAFAPATDPDALIVSRGVAGVLGCRRRDGELLWGTPVPMIHQWNTVSVRSCIHVLHFGRSYVIDESSGAILADRNYDDVFERGAWRAWTPIAHENLVAYTMESSVAAVFRVPDGELVSWCRYKYGLGRPTIAEPYVLAIGSDGWLVCFGDPELDRGRRRRRTTRCS